MIYINDTSLQLMGMNVKLSDIDLFLPETDGKIQRSLCGRCLKISSFNEWKRSACFKGTCKPKRRTNGKHRKQTVDS